MCINSLYSVCIGKVNTCIQWSKHFFTPLFHFGKTVQILHSKICYKTGHCYSEASRVNQTIIVKKLALLKRMSRWWWRQPSLPMNHHHHCAHVLYTWKNCQVKTRRKHTWLNYNKTRNCTVEAWDKACYDYKCMQDERMRVGWAISAKDRFMVQEDPLLEGSPLTVSSRTSPNWAF